MNDVRTPADRASDDIPTDAHDGRPAPPRPRGLSTLSVVLLILIGLGLIVIAVTHIRRSQPVLPDQSLLGIAGTDETEPSMDEDKQQITQSMAGKDIDAVDRLLSQRQSDYETGQLSDVGLRNVFDGFTNPTPDARAFVDRWVAERPQSYVARLARGIFYRSLGEAERGGKWAQDTPESNLRVMHDAFEIAFDELTRSLRLTKKPIISYQYLISIGKHEEGMDFLRRQRNAANTLDPKNFVVRRIFLRMLRPRWHGSMRAMNSFVEDSRKAGLPPSQLSELEALVQLEYAYQAAQAEQWPIAFTRYTRAAKAFPHSNVELWNGYAQAALKMPDRCAVAMPILTNLEAIRGYGDQSAADRRWVPANRAFCLGQQGDQPAALAEVRVAAELGDSWSQTELGEMLWHGSHAPQDQDAAKMWWQKAAAQGDQRAAQLLKGVHQHS